MIFDSDSEPKLKIWIMDQLKHICETDVYTLAEYILTLLASAKEMKSSEVKDFMINELEDFIIGGEVFVSNLLKVLEDKSFLTKESIDQQQMGATLDQLKTGYSDDEEEEDRYDNDDENKRRRGRQHEYDESNSPEEDGGKASEYPPVDVLVKSDEEQRDDRNFQAYRESNPEFPNGEVYNSSPRSYWEGGRSEAAVSRDPNILNRALSSRDDPNERDMYNRKRSWSGNNRNWAVGHANQGQNYYTSGQNQGVVYGGSVDAVGALEGNKIVAQGKAYYGEGGHEQQRRGGGVGGGGGRYGDAYGPGGRHQGGRAGGYPQGQAYLDKYRGVGVAASAGGMAGVNYKGGGQGQGWMMNASPSAVSASNMYGWGTMPYGNAGAAGGSMFAQNVPYGTAVMGPSGPMYVTPQMLSASMYSMPGYANMIMPQSLQSGNVSAYGKSEMDKSVDSAGSSRHLQDPWKQQGTTYQQQLDAYYQGGGGGGGQYSDVSAAAGSVASSSRPPIPPGAPPVALASTLSPEATSEALAKTSEKPSQQPLSAWRGKPNWKAQQDGGAAAPEGQTAEEVAAAKEKKARSLKWVSSDPAGGAQAEALAAAQAAALADKVAVQQQYEDLKKLRQQADDIWKKKETLLQTQVDNIRAMIAKVGSAESSRALIDNLEGKLIDFQSQIQELRQQKDASQLEQSKPYAHAYGAGAGRGRQSYRGRGRGRGAWAGRGGDGTGTRSWVAPGQDGDKSVVNRVGNDEQSRSVLENKEEEVLKEEEIVNVFDPSV